MKKKIAFILPGTNMSGGVRVVFEFASIAIKLGHHVDMYFPRVAPRLLTKSIAKKAAAYLLDQLRPGRRTFTLDPYYEHLSGHIFSLSSLNPYSNKIVNQLDGYEFVISTAWQTLPFVNKLEIDAKKRYFMQHYEVWPLWNDKFSWVEAEKCVPGSPDEGMALIQGHNKFLKDYKEAVDSTYRTGSPIITTSRWENRILNRLKADNNIIGNVCYGVNRELFYPENVEKQAFTVVALYRNSLHKGDNEVFAAFRKLKNKMQAQVDLVLFGKTKPSHRMEGVSFYENPSQSTIRSLYNRADILLYPSWVEGFGMPPMEAMSCGTAVVGFKVGALPDYGEDIVEFVDHWDVDGLVNKIEWLKASPTILKEKKRKGIERMSELTWARFTEDFLELL